jgi:flagellar basal-body rod protein FlgB
MNRLTDSLNFQAQALMLRSERQRVISSNIANADTPGYQAREMDFAQALRQATGQAARPAALQATAAGTRLMFARPSQTSVDGNTVDMDRERASFVDNSVKYEATLRFITSHVRTALDAMRSHNQG